jgi:hypothetical protein
MTVHRPIKQAKVDLALKKPNLGPLLFQRGVWQSPIVSVTAKEAVILRRFVKQGEPYGRHHFPLGFFSPLSPLRDCFFY